MEGAETSPVKINLKGFAVGDACTGTEVLCGDTGQGPWWDLTFMYVCGRARRARAGELSAGERVERGRASRARASESSARSLVD